MSVRIWLSLGSNIEREKNIRSAVAQLRREYGNLLMSPVYESEAIGFDGDPFFNLVVGLDSDESMQAIVAGLRRIEGAHGRHRGGEKFAARTLDIDLLTYGDLQLNEDGVEVPRDEITRYAYVLKPLAKVAPNEIHPLEGRSYLALWEEFDASRQRIWPVDLPFE